MIKKNNEIGKKEKRDNFFLYYFFFFYFKSRIYRYMNIRSIFYYNSKSPNPNYNTQSQF